MSTTFRITVTTADGEVIESALYDAATWHEALRDASQDASIMGALVGDHDKGIDE